MDPATSSSTTPPEDSKDYLISALEISEAKKKDLETYERILKGLHAKLKMWCPVQATKDDAVFHLKILTPLLNVAEFVMEQEPVLKKYVKDNAVTVLVQYDPAQDVPEGLRPSWCKCGHCKATKYPAGSGTSPVPAPQNKEGRKLVPWCHCGECFDDDEREDAEAKATAEAMIDSIQRDKKDD